MKVSLHAFFFLHCFFRPQTFACLLIVRVKICFWKVFIITREENKDICSVLAHLSN